MPLWFGNEHAKDEENPVYGTAMVLAYLLGSPELAHKAQAFIADGVTHLLKTQKGDGSWGGDENAPSSIEETAVALTALCRSGAPLAAREKAASWLISATRGGTHFPPAPIGLYFARLWYHEQLYPVVWTLQALRAYPAKG